MADTDGFVRVPNTLIEHSDMTAHELLVYIVLLKHRDHRTGKCWPGFATIADESRLSRNTVIRTIVLLEERGTIDVTRRRDAHDRNRPNEYTVYLYDEKNRDWVSTSSKGKRKPRRNLSEESRERLAEAGRRRGTSASEPLAPEEDASPSASQALPSTSEAPPLVPPRHPNKNHKNKNHEEAITPALTSRGARVKFQVIEDKATTKQQALLSDLWLHNGAGIPTKRTRDQWANLTVIQAAELIQKYYRSVERHDGYTGPEHGTPDYEALSEDGKRWADAYMIPDNYIEGAA